jgi:phosphatidylserine decarboxylase
LVRRALSRNWHTLLGLLPRGIVFGLARALGECRWRLVVRLLIGAFRAGYRVDLADAASSDPRSYPSFNAFFSRALREGARPVDPQAMLTSPCDGVVTSSGPVHSGSVVQAKGIDYSIAELLADKDTAARFEGGRQLTIYLAPADYHRVHVPAAGRLTGLKHIPGRLLAVNPSSRSSVPRLYSRNERLVACFDTALGPIGLVLVAAIGVSGIRLAREGTLSRALHGGAAVAADDASAVYAAAEEFARFEMGSTVILLTGPAARDGWTLPISDTRLLMGERLA